MSRYSCAGCGLAVIVLDGQTVRACTCDAAIVADMSVTLAGRGGVKG